MQRFRIFVSSPRDVGSERAVAARVIERLRFEFRGQLDIAPVFWEQMPMRATDTFQAQIPLASQSDLCVFILWSWFGTPLPEDFRRPDGTVYASGTEFEFEEALASHSKTGTPDILVYRKTAELRAAIQDRDQVLERLAQRDAVQAFIEHYFRGEGGTFKAAFRQFESPADFEEMLETHLRELIRGRLQGAPDRDIAAPLWTESPFRGLQIFDREHALIFCGRTHVVTEVIDALRRQAEAGRPCVLVTGTSGSGKSSLVRAGVVPMLVQPRVVEEVTAWRQAIFRPNDQAAGPIDSLAAALLTGEALPELAAAGTDAVALAGLLRDKPAALLPLLAMALQRAAEPAQTGAVAAERTAVQRLVLVIDQLEELFAVAVAKAERDAFAAALAALAQGGQVWVIATLRSDFYPRCSELPEAFATLIRGEGSYELRPPGPAEIAQMIRRPAQIAGLAFERRPDTEEGLDDVLRDDAAAHPTALPLLQFALDELYKRRSGPLLRFADYEALGGLEGALRQRAEEEYGSLPEPTRAALPSILSALVRVAIEDDAVAARRVPRAQLEVLPGAIDLADAFVAARLFVADRAESDGATIGVAHEALLREWPRAAQWIADNKEKLRARARIGAAAMLWRDAGQDAARLLPPGKALVEANALATDKSIALTPVIADFIAASLHAFARRRRRRRFEFAAAAAALLGLVAAGAFYYDGYVRPTPRDYLTFVRRFGIVAGLGPELSSEAVRHRGQSIRLTFAGRYGPPQRDELVNGHGLCPQNPTASTFLGDLRALGKSLRECRWEMTYKDGKVTGEIAYDAYGRLVYSFLYSDDARTTGVYHADTGGAMSLAHSGASGLHFTRISEGRDIGLDRSVHYLNAYGSPEPDLTGSYGRNFTYDEAGRVVALTELGADDKPVLPRGGAATTLVGYDASGYMIRVDYRDENGRPMKRPQLGAAAATFDYDAFGNPLVMSLLDERGKLVNGAEGYAQLKRVFDEWGDEIENSAWDKYGQALRTKNGYAKSRQRFDDRGRWIEQAFFAEDGTPIAPSPISEVVRVAYDGFGNIVETGYFTHTGEPFTIPAGYARLRKTYDGHSNVTSDTYLDAQGDPVTIKSGIAQTQFQYDGNDRLIAQIYRDLSGNPVRNSEGVAEVDSGYDDRGNMTSVAFADEHGKPIAARQGWARKTMSYDDHGYETTESYFDAQGQPVLLFAGYTTVTYAYDKGGDQVELAHYAAPGQLLDKAKGCPRVTHAYDDYRREIETACRDGSGGLVMVPQWGYARVTLTRDDRGNPVEAKFFDDQNRPLIGPQGFAAAKFVYDDDDNRIEAAFLDPNGRPIAPKQFGCAHPSFTYDKGKRTGTKCLDPPPSPAPKSSETDPVSR
ncbi:MAG: AAA family ATPase [Alphaproteobacteria bacterium]|nr:AAA family ATPase [Alphaproteobacteria bacterium]